MRHPRLNHEATPQGIRSRLSVGNRKQFVGITMHNQRRHVQARQAGRTIGRAEGHAEMSATTAHVPPSCQLSFGPRAEDFKGFARCIQQTIGRDVPIDFGHRSQHGPGKPAQKREPR